MSKYSKKAGEKAEREPDMKEGQLRRGSGKKGNRPKQSIAVGLAETKKEEARLPARPVSEMITAIPKRKSARPSE